MGRSSVGVFRLVLELVGWTGCLTVQCFGELFEFHGRLAAGDSAISSLGYDELRTAFSAYVAFAGLVSQLLNSMTVMLFRAALGPP